MSKNIQLTIPKPCHENWDAMSDVQKGKFCGACQKQVVDFTNMNDRQLAEFFKKPSTGSVCGRFMTDQLEREIEIPRKRIPWLKYFFTIALPAFFISKAAAQKPRMMGMVAKPRVNDTTKMVTVPVKRMLGEVAPICIKPVETDTLIKPIKGKIRTTTINKVEENKITGAVFNEKMERVAGASISIRGTRVGVVSKEDGTFSITVPDKEWQTLSLIISYINYETTEKIIIRDATDKEVQISITPNPYDSFMTGAIVVTTKRVQKKSTVPFDLITGAKSNNQSNFNLFPNPLPAGSALNIEWKATEEGYYQLQLINQSGQQVHQQEIWIDAAAKVLNLDIPTVAAGSYFLALINKKTGKKFTEKLIIQ
jgi:CarboxypepD_reg-like domain/Secretion system C-terminal sorting domain